MSETCGCGWDGGLRRYCEAHNPCFGTVQPMSEPDASSPSVPKECCCNTGQPYDFTRCPIHAVGVFFEEASVPAVPVEDSVACGVKREDYQQQRQSCKQCGGSIDKGKDRCLECDERDDYLEAEIKTLEAKLAQQETQLQNAQRRIKRLTKMVEKWQAKT